MREDATRSTHRRPRWWRRWGVVGAALALTGCAGARPAQVSPEEIPALEERLAREPENGDVLLRYAAALFAAGRCDSATAVARRGALRRPQSAVAPLVTGQCHERAGRYDEAIDVYARFGEAHPRADGIGAVRAREALARRERANARAREALARESELAAEPADPQTIAVLPLDIAASDTTLRPLGRGLAQMLISDLDLIQQFRLVERLELGALLDELALGQTERVDPATVARVGRLLQAGRMVQGLATIPPTEQVRLEASVVRADGEVTLPAAVRGRFRDLLEMEKELVVELSARLGYTLSEAERRLVLENGTRNLAAFLAYSRGLVAEDEGDWSAAAAHFRDAVRRDPSFQQAQVQYQAAAAAPTTQQASAGDVTTLAAEPSPEATAAATEPVVESGLTSGVGDLAGTTSEQVTAAITPSATPLADPPPTVTGTGTPTTVTGVIRIFFILP